MLAVAGDSVARPDQRQIERHAGRSGRDPAHRPGPARQRSGPIARRLPHAPGVRARPGLRPHCRAPKSWRRCATPCASTGATPSPGLQPRRHRLAHQPARQRRRVQPGIPCPPAGAGRRSQPPCSSTAASSATRWSRRWPPTASASPTTPPITSSPAANWAPTTRLLLDSGRVVSVVADAIAARRQPIEAANPSTALKALKNPRRARPHPRRHAPRRCRAGARRSAGWSNASPPAWTLTELDVDTLLHEERSGQPRFVGESFATIAGYQANGALPHYRATPEQHSTLQRKGPAAGRFGRPVPRRHHRHHPRAGAGRDHGRSSAATPPW